VSGAADIGAPPGAADTGASRGVPETGASPGAFRSGFVAVLGRPNVGKSTLVNRLVGRKVSIISDHPQTTRRRISGVVTSGTHQIVLLDLPGFQRPFDSLTRRMQATVDGTLAEVDAALVVLNAAEELGGGDRFIVAAVAAKAVPAVVALNKVDLLRAREVPAHMASAARLCGELPLLAVSALKGTGLEAVMEGLSAAMPEGPRYFPDGETSDQPLEVLVGELVREQALRVTREEVPHAIAVEVESMSERPGGSLVTIEANLIVESESQKVIVVGKRGEVVKRIGSEARREIETVIGAHVYLALHVKVRKRWRRDERYVSRLL
jgi:GTP-binding protein Era